MVAVIRGGGQNDNYVGIFAAYFDIVRNMWTATLDFVAFVEFPSDVDPGCSFRLPLSRENLPLLHINSHLTSPARMVF